MKIVAWYVERCRVVKNFKYKASLFVGVIASLIGLGLNMSVGYNFKQSLVMGLILGLFVLVMWLLFIRQTIKFSEKQKLRREEEERRVKEEKRNRARERSEKKLNKK